MEGWHYAQPNLNRHVRVGSDERVPCRADHLGPTQRHAAWSGPTVGPRSDNVAYFLLDALFGPARDLLKCHRAEKRSGNARRSRVVIRRLPTEEVRVPDLHFVWRLG